MKPEMIYEYHTGGPGFKILLGEEDTVLKFGEGILPENVEWKADGENMVVTVTQEGVVNTILAEGLKALKMLSRIEFNNGTVFGRNEMLNTMGWRPIVMGTEGDDSIFVELDQTVVYSGSGNDSIYGQGYNDLKLYGGDGDDSINTLTPSRSRAAADQTAYSNLLAGGNGNDTLVAGFGDDLLFGEAGADTLDGGAGNDQLFGAEGMDVLYGGDGLDFLSGGMESDQLYGGNEDDVLEGGGGTDYMEGGAGNDTYIIDTGAWVEYINDYGVPDTNVDTIQFRGGLNSSDAIFEISGGNLEVGFKNRTEKAIIQSYLKSDDCKIERFEFSNNVVWGIDYINSLVLDQTGSTSDDILYGTDGVNHLYGLAGEDTFISNGGNDEMYGGKGNDIYWMNKGDGADTIIDFDTTVDNLDTVMFGDDLESSHAVVTLRGTDLIIGFDNSAEVLTVKDHLMGTGNNTVERFVFGDGEEWTWQTVRDMELTNTGTDSGELMYGTYGSCILDAKAGDDILYGFFGNDTLIGGAGNDSIVGGHGSDTYIFETGFGKDTVKDYDSMTDSIDVFKFGEGFSADHLSVSAQGDDLLLGFAGSADQVVIKNFLLDDAYKIEQFKFADGSVIEADAIDGMLQSGLLAQAMGGFAPMTASIAVQEMDEKGFKPLELATA